MTDKNDNMAALTGWLEEKCGHIQTQCVLNEITKMQFKDALECMEIMLLADIIHGYRKDMLRQVKEFKDLRAQEYTQDVATFHVRKELKSMKEEIMNGIACWSDLREMYFFERARYMERCKWPHSVVAVLSNPRYEQQFPPQSV